MVRLGVVGAVLAVLLQATGCSPRQTPDAQGNSFQTLADDLARDRIDLDTFWANVKQTPMIDDLAGKPDEALYTFLWRPRPSEDASRVKFTAQFPLPDGTVFDSLKQLEDADVWYASYALPRSVRIVYGFATPRGAEPSPEAMVQVDIGGVPHEILRDPLNPRTAEEDTAVVSYAEGPAAVANPFLRTDAQVPVGSVEVIQIDSKALGSKRTVTVYTPPAYGGDEPDLPLVLLFDGRQYTSASVPTPPILDNMIAAGAIPPVVALFVHTPQETRNQDLLPNPAFRAFLIDELMPWARQRYRVSADPAKNVIGGSSLGGFAAAYTALLRPDVFGNVISLSGSYWWSPDGSPGRWLVKEYAGAPRQPINFYLNIGSWEGELGLPPNREMHSVLQSKGYVVTYREFAGGHAYLNWRDTLPEALAAVLR